MANPVQFKVTRNKNKISSLNNSTSLVSSIKALEVQQIGAKEENFSTEEIATTIVSIDHKLNLFI